MIARTRREHAGTPASVRLFIAGGLWLLVSLCTHAQTAAEQRFMWNQANATFASSRTADDFRRAAETYQALVDSGVRNGPLFDNLGIALLNGFHSA